MTLADLANFVCGKINQTDATDLAMCKSFLQRRFEMIWNDQLWTDAIFEYTQTITSQGYTVNSTWLPTHKVLLLPPVIDRVLAVRTDTRKLDVESSPTLYRYDADLFAASGNTTKFRNLPKCVWDLDTAQTLYALAAANDAGLVLTLSVLEGDGVTADDIAKTLTAGGNALESVLTVFAAGKAASNSSVSVGPVGLVQVTAVNNYASALDFCWLQNNVSDNTTRITVQPGQSGTMPAQPVDYPYIGVFPTGFHGIPDQALNVGNNFVGTVTAAANETLSSAAGSTLPIFTMAATDETAPKRCRIGLIGVVTDNTVLRVLGKVKAPTFSHDTDEPGLSNVENCLIAFAMGDMLQRERQYGKAQQMAQEGATLLEQMKRLQTVQQAHNQRFMPQDGYGPDYQIYNSPLTF